MREWGEWGREQRTKAPALDQAGPLSDDPQASPVGRPRGRRRAECGERRDPEGESARGRHLTGKGDGDRFGGGKVGGRYTQIWGEKR